MAGFEFGAEMVVPVVWQTSHCLSTQRAGEFKRLLAVVMAEKLPV